MKYFTSPRDLVLWVLSQDGAEAAAGKIFDIIGEDLSVKDACFDIFRYKEQESHIREKAGLHGDIIAAVEGLYGVLSQYKLVESVNNKENGEVKMSENQNAKWNMAQRITKEAQYREPASPIVYNRETDNNYDNTQWRKDRDQMYGFIHRNPDMISFDKDGKHVYSGEALWRAYVMDKFSRDYKNENGRVVGGYINDRFQVFHDVAGNQMELANWERTRKPRPHQYSTERRLEEARGNKLEDIEPLKQASSKDVIKIASKDTKNLDGDSMAEMFTDILDMKAASIDDEDIICKIAEHYDEDVINVTSLHKLAMRQQTLHSGVLYSADEETGKKKVVKAAVNWSTLDINEGDPMIVTEGLNFIPLSRDANGNFIRPDNRSIVNRSLVTVYPIINQDMGGNTVYVEQQQALNRADGSSAFQNTIYYMLSNSADQDKIVSKDEYESFKEVGLDDDPSVKQDENATPDNMGNKVEDGINKAPNQTETQAIMDGNMGGDVGGNENPATGGM